MFRRTKVNAGVLAALGAMSVSSALAQDQQTQTLERVEITGSAIKRIDAETVVPVTVLRADTLRKEGITTIEQIFATITAGQTQTSTGQAIGAGTGGASFADLRGVGPNKTLVLLNGRRIANNAIDGSAPDLNMIPFAALDRVEVLRDGASSLYGTDAIGGVINFITKREVKGGAITLGADVPQHAGGKNYNANLSAGFGDLAGQGFNVFGVLDLQKQDAITGTQRSLSDRGARRSPITFPANYTQDTAPGIANPLGPACDSPYLAPPAVAGVGDTSCTYRTIKWVDYIPKSERSSALLKGTLKVADAHELGLEFFHTKSKVFTTIAPVPDIVTVNPGTKYFPGNGIVPAPPADAGIDLTQPVDAYFRYVPQGPRRGQTDNTQQRFAASLEGNVAGWDYRTGFTYNINKIVDKLTGGYSDGALIAAGVASGVINPFGDQDAAGLAALANAYALGTLQTAKGTVSAVDAKGSRELGDWFGAGQPAALALGAEFRREKFYDKANVPVAEANIASTGFDPATNNEGSRNVAAVYAELNIPFTKTFEATAAVRYDKYSDFGNTTNPKFGFRYQPTRDMLMRGSYSTGFRAPSLYELNSPQTYTNTSENHFDPVLCTATGVPAPGSGVNARYCDVQYQSLLGGNPKLKPEKSKSLNFGLVFQPNVDANIGIDFWWLRLRQQINGLDDNTVFSDPAKYAGLFHRAPNGRLSIIGSDCPGVDCGYVELTTQNLGGVNTNGIDLNASYRIHAGNTGSFLLNGALTYVTKYEYQNEQDGVWNQNVGVYSGAAPIFRIQSTFGVTWTREEWSIGTNAHYKSGYRDVNKTNLVSRYLTLDAYATWQPTKAVSLTFGVRNLGDTAPPWSVQQTTFQQGYDPRFYDPTGRVFYLRGTYSF
ncbi:MAG: TonB-dependent receptor [Proteobacteria bacterium]|nr:TonB-dependent receptor [Pseudomonadota bacterium]